MAADGPYGRGFGYFELKFSANIYWNNPWDPASKKKWGHMWCYVAKIFTSPVIHRSLKIALATLGDRGLWGGSIIWKGPNCLNLDTRYLHVSLLLFFSSVFLESWTPTLLKILDFGFTVFARRARTGRTDGVRTDTYGSVSKFTPIWNFYHVTSNFFGILLKFLALNWHSSTLLISIGSEISRILGGQFRLGGARADMNAIFRFSLQSDRVEKNE